MTNRKATTGALFFVVVMTITAAASAQTETTMPVRDGSGSTQTLRVDRNSDGSLATHNVPEVGGAAVTSTNPLPTAPGAYTLTAPDASTVAVGGTAVTAFAAGHRMKGGWIHNPANAGSNLCINEISTASGTTSNGATTCIQPGSNFGLAPSTSSVSVIAADSGHVFSGEGFN